jgi:hypothetical protein
VRAFGRGRNILLPAWNAACKLTLVDAGELVSGIAMLDNCQVGIDFAADGLGDNP